MLPMNCLHAIRRWAASFLFFCLSASGTFAQTPAPEPRPAITVSGTLRNSAGDAVPDASVFLEEKATAAIAETRTKSDGTFAFLALRPGTYTIRAEKIGMRSAASVSLLLSAGEKKQVDLVLDKAQPQESPPLNPGKSAASAAGMEFDDKPSFTIAGVTDWTNVGGHGSDTKLRTSESLARETATLKSAEPAHPPATTESVLAADSHREAADRAERSGDPLTAEREYAEAVRGNPSEQNYFAWGSELLLHRAIRPAAEVFTKGAALHPKSARMLAGLGAALYAGGSYADAANRLCAASDLQPADPSPYVFLGKMEKAAPEPLPCAAEKLARFAHDQPGNASANYYLAVALWKGAQRNANPANLRQCESLLHKAIAADPNLDAAYVQLGIVYTARADFVRAIEAYKKAVELNPQSSEAHYRLAQAYKRVGEEENAQRETQLYKQADQTETAAVEQQRREIRQFLIILNNQPQPQKQN